MNVYLIITTFSYRERTRRYNILSLTFDFHENNFNDVVAVLRSLYHLNVN